MTLPNKNVHNQNKRMHTFSQHEGFIIWIMMKNILIYTKSIIVRLNVKTIYGYANL